MKHRQGHTKPDLKQQSSKWHQLSNHQNTRRLDKISYWKCSLLSSCKTSNVLGVIPFYSLFHIPSTHHKKMTTQYTHFTLLLPVPPRCNTSTSCAFEHTYIISYISTLVDKNIVAVIYDKALILPGCVWTISQNASRINILSITH
jgi:hypothetical protein